MKCSIMLPFIWVFTVCQEPVQEFPVDLYKGLKYPEIYKERHFSDCVHVQTGLRQLCSISAKSAFWFSNKADNMVFIVNNEQLYKPINVFVNG